MSERGDGKAIDLSFYERMSLILLHQIASGVSLLISKTQTPLFDNELREVIGESQLVWQQTMTELSRVIAPICGSLESYVQQFTDSKPD